MSFSKLLPSVFSRSFASKAASEVSLPVLRPFKVHRLENAPSDTVTTNKDEMLSFYRQMTYYRRFEIVADTLYKQRLIRGFCHLYDGQEAIITGMNHVLQKKDSVVTGYREHCYQLARGGSGESTMAELLGKSTGCSKGKGGSMHMYHKEGNFYGGNGIVGAQVPLGAGFAYKHKYLKDGGLAVAAFGDGASNQGQIFEAANMAALWKLPLIFLCENNEYGMGTPVKRGSASTLFYTKGDYVPGIWIDGMDVLAVKEGFRFAAEYVRAGNGPLFIECQTYRYHGHSMSDPGISYRTRDEVSLVREQRDCIERVKAILKEQKWASDAELKAIEKEVRQQVDEEVEAAKAAKELPVGEMFTEVYRGAPPPFIRTVDFRESPTDADVKASV